MFNSSLDMGVRFQEMWELMTKTLWVPVEELETREAVQRLGMLFERIVSVENRASRRKSREVWG